MNATTSTSSTKAYLLDLQSRLCNGFAELDGVATFNKDVWQHAQGQGGGITRVLQDGRVFEKGGVNFSHIRGEALPAAASQKRPELAGKNFEAMGVSVVMHPRNPFAPTSHMNVRFFVAGDANEEQIWWFGGGFDLTPYYGFEEDAIEWHQAAQNACLTLGTNAYTDYKKWCDEYFYLPHRSEARGIGGIFFDDLNTPDFDSCFQFWQQVGNSYASAYPPIVDRRCTTPYEEQHRQWQLLRRGRYVEFNLVLDRGTLFGLQSGGRAESILVSMPPLVSWHYQHVPEHGSEEERLLKEFLPAKNWLV